MLWPTCPLCGCPGGLQLLFSVSCPNERCRNFDGSLDYDHVRRTINGVPERVIYLWKQKQEKDDD